MTTVPYTLTIADGPAYWQVGILWVMLATAEQTGGNYTLLWELCPKGSGPTPHYHDQDEQFFVLDGQITYRAGDQMLVATTGVFVLIPRGTVHSFRVDSETATILNSYTPGGFERVIRELGEPALTRTLPPTSRPMIAHPEHFEDVLARIGMHLVDQPDILREQTTPDETNAAQ